VGFIVYLIGSETVWSEDNQTTNVSMMNHKQQSPSFIQGRQLEVFMEGEKLVSLYWTLSLKVYA